MPLFFFDHILLSDIPIVKLENLENIYIRIQHNLKAASYVAVDLMCVTPAWLLILVGSQEICAAVER